MPCARLRDWSGGSSIGRMHCGHGVTLKQVRHVQLQNATLWPLGRGGCMLYPVPPHTTAPASCGGRPPPSGEPPGPSGRPPVGRGKGESEVRGKVRSDSEVGLRSVVWAQGGGDSRCTGARGAAHGLRASED